jgi:hypothetical protein
MKRGKYEMPETLAREVLRLALELWGKRAGDRLTQLKVLHPDGSQSPLFYVSQKGLGTILYDYIPEAAIESIIANCERKFDAREELRSWPAEGRASTIKNMAVACTANLLLDLPARLGDALQMAFEESLLYTEAALESGPAHFTGGIADATGAINELVDIYADKQRKRISAKLKRMARSEVFTPEDDPRLPKITLGRLKLAYKAAKKRKGEDERVLQGDVAKKLHVHSDTLGRWCKEELQLTRWSEVVKYLETT